MVEYLPHSPKQIVIIDGKQAEGQLLANILSQHGYAFRAYSDSESALADMNLVGPALVLFDVTAVAMDGYELCRRLKGDALTAAIPIILITDNETPFDKEQAFAAGAADYISKPFATRELLTKVATHLRLFALEQFLANPADDTLYPRPGKSSRSPADEGLTPDWEYQGFRTLVENSPDYIGRYDRNGRILYVNPAVEKLFGRPLSELIGKTPLELFPGTEAAQNFYDTLKKAVKTKTLAETAVVIDDIPGQGLIYHHLRFIPEYDSDGKVVSVLFIGQDITERRRMETELRTSETRYRALVQSQIDLISRYRPDTILTFVNDAYCEFYGKTREELIGQSFLTMVAPEFREQVLKETEAYTKDPTPRGGEYLNYTWDGQARWIHWIIQGIVDENGKVVELQASGRDVTPLKEAEAEIRRLNEELEQRVAARTTQLEAANKELEAFSYSVSHDLRAPLRAIDGYSRILVEDYESVLGAEGERICSIIRSETQRMSQLIDDLLTFSRLGRTEMRITTINMTNLVDSIYHEITMPEERDKIDFHFGFLPPAAGDPSLIRQVWVNLLTNAIKFSAKQLPAIIEVGGEHDGDEVTYFIRDNGAGFDMQYANKLFGVFQRLHSEREFPGTGVGLAIVQRIIHRHGGRIWAEGTVNQGALFAFSLPYKRKGVT